MVSHGSVYVTCEVVGINNYSMRLDKKNQFVNENLWQHHQILMSASIRMLVDTEKQASQINRSQYLVGWQVDRHVITKTIREFIILINLL